MAFTPIPDLALPVGASSLGLNLGAYFNLDDITGTLVQLATTIGAKGKRKGGTLFLELFDQPNPVAARTTPVTAANFLGYVDAGSYNGSIFHRLAFNSSTDPLTGGFDRSSPFVLQGGGFRLPLSASPAVGFYPPTSISQGPTIRNEPGNTNVLGTVAMAKTDAADSATNQFFFNLADNRFLDSPLRSGGFTVFGRLVGNSLGLLQRLVESVGIINGNKPFNELPVQGYKPARPDSPLTPLRLANYLTITTAARSPEFAYKVKAKGATASVDSGGQLQLQWRVTPTKPVKVSIQATSVLDPSERYSDSFLVLPPSQQASSLPADPLASLVSGAGPLL